MHTLNIILLDLLLYFKIQFFSYSLIDFINVSTLFCEIRQELYLHLTTSISSIAYFMTLEINSHTFTKFLDR